MVLAGFGVTAWTDSPLLIALAALLGETLGFYVVLALTVYGEQWSYLQNRTACAASCPAAHGGSPRCGVRRRRASSTP